MLLMVVATFLGLRAPSPVAAQTTYTDGALFREQFDTTVSAYAFGGNATFSGGVLRLRYIPEYHGSSRLTKQSNDGL